MIEVVCALQNLMGRSDLHPKILNLASAEIRDQSLHCAKAQKVLGWKPKVKFKELVKIMLEHDLKEAGLDRKQFIKIKK